MVQRTSHHNPHTAGQLAGLSSARGVKPGFSGEPTMKLTALFAAVGHGIMAAAEKFETSTAGQTVATDASKTLSDAASAAIGFVQQGATQPAVDAIAPALTKIGIPAAISTGVASMFVQQGEGFLGQLVAKI